FIKSTIDAKDIYYTIDGSTPTEGSKKYTEPFTLTETAVVRAMSVKDGVKNYSMTCYDIDDTSKIPDITTHFPSPENEWKDEVIYFAMTDRFADGDPSNNKQTTSGAETGMTESQYNGGDFQGLINRLDYIKGLGFTTIWITPPINNQFWLGGDFQYGGYHGYWASDFKDTDPHYGTIAKYKEFVDKAHEKGLRVIQDIVVNHVGDYFYTPKVIKTLDDINGNYKLKKGALPFDNPVQIPWKFNDPSIFTAEEFENDSFYHWTPPVTDFTNLTSYYDNQMSDLDDMNTDNPVVANLLRGYFRFWIDKVGIDGYRVDTILYVKPKFFEGFVNSTEEGNLGIREYAKSKGKNDFILFGEAYNPNDTVGALYTKDSQGNKRLNSVIYFPLRYAILDVFANGSATSKISEVLSKRYTSGYANPDKLVTFVDNHDVARVLSLTRPENVKSAYAFVFTIPGVPQVYYGAEQGFKTQRGTMFKGGYHEEGSVNTADVYNESGEWYDFMKGIVNLRKNNRVFRYGKQTILKDATTGPGILSYKMVEGDGGIDKSAFVIFNTSGGNILANIETGFNEGDKFELLSPSQGSIAGSFVVKKGGVATIDLPANSFGIYVLKSVNQSSGAGTITNTVSLTTVIDATVDALKYTFDGAITESLGAGHKLRLVMDGKYQTAPEVTLSGLNWTYTYDLNKVSNGRHEVAALIDTGDINTMVFSKSIYFTLAKPYIEVVSVSDPAGDDTGPAGYNYTLPTDISFHSPKDSNDKSDYKGHPEDITNVRIFVSGNDL
ncbi:MAG TPA: alpha-amylase family glycosyl hydrolase, partial [Spirochaetota bacterium]|nr:alpha-amylase family glycosyl hydrolase [Spirochaetota bacterium]